MCLIRFCSRSSNPHTSAERGRIIVVMYMHEPAEASADLSPLSGGLAATVWFSALGTLVLGIFPSLILNFAGNSALLAR